MELKTMKTLLLSVEISFQPLPSSVATYILIEIPHR